MQGFEAKPWTLLTEETVTKERAVLAANSCAHHRLRSPEAIECWSMQRSPHFVNVVVLAGIPFLIYFTYHRLRHKRPLREVARRAGLQPGEPKYLAYSAAFALVVVAAILIWSPPLESFLRAESPQRDFKGLGLSGTALARWRCCTVS